MKSKEVLKLLGISRVTLWSYVKNGTIKAAKLPNGYYDYDDKSIHDFFDHKKKINIIYTRVSTYKKKDDIVRQSKNQYLKFRQVLIFFR